MEPNIRSAGMFPIQNNQQITYQDDCMMLTLVLITPQCLMLALYKQF